MKMSRATFAAGSFWDAEYAYSHVKGVVSTTVGYMGGSFHNPTYRDVCSGRTGHVEVVEMIYDPTVVSYEYLLELFWHIHNPTQNRPGSDMGEQHRSVIFYHTLDQQAVALASKAELESSGKFEQPLQTEILPVAKFYRAEEYHHQYLRQRSVSRGEKKNLHEVTSVQKHQ
jgi:peptide-methionine (S)-S-oxide reductase